MNSVNFSLTLLGRYLNFLALLLRTKSTSICITLYYGNDAMQRVVVTGLGAVTPLGQGMWHPRLLENGTFLLSILSCLHDPIAPIVL